MPRLLPKLVLAINQSSGYALSKQRRAASISELYSGMLFKGYLNRTPHISSRSSAGVLIICRLHLYHIKAGRMSKFQRLVRFEDPQGQVHYGELGGSDLPISNFTGRKVNVYEGSTPWSDEFYLTTKKGKIAKVCICLPCATTMTN